MPRNLGVSCAQFDACGRVPSALARPAIEADQKVLALTAIETGELFKCFMNGYDNGEYVEFFLSNRRVKKGFRADAEKIARVVVGKIKA